MKSLVLQFEDWSVIHFDELPACIDNDPELLDLANEYFGDVYVAAWVIEELSDFPECHYNFTELVPSFLKSNLWIGTLKEDCEWAGENLYDRFIDECEKKGITQIYSTHAD